MQPHGRNQACYVYINHSGRCSHSRKYILHNWHGLLNQHLSWIKNHQEIKLRTRWCVHLHCTIIKSFFHLSFLFNLFLAQEDIEHLVLTERIETLVPMSYIAIMVMAYFGPNATILGSVKLAIWHHQSTIQDINAFVSNVGLLFGVDLMSFIINGIILWTFCKVNVLKVLQKLQKQYWFIYTFAEAFLVTEVN